MRLLKFACNVALTWFAAAVFGGVCGALVSLVCGPLGLVVTVAVTFILFVWLL